MPTSKVVPQEALPITSEPSDMLHLQRTIDSLEKRERMAESAASADYPRQVRQPQLARGNK